MCFGYCHQVERDQEDKKDDYHNTDAYTLLKVVIDIDRFAVDPFT